MLAMNDVIILGAGPAGLGAAYRIAGRGVRVLVLERSDGVGGLAGSFEVGGMPVDHGSHRLHPSTHPEIMQDLRRLLGTDLQTRRRHGRIHLEGRWIAFPLRFPDLIANLPPRFAAAAARDACLGLARKPRGDSFAALLQAGLGPTVCRRFYFPYARKLWGLDPEQIHGEQARRRVSGNAVGKVLRKLGGGASGGFFYYPRRGFGQIWERLAAAAAEAGAGIRLRAAVQRVEVAAGGFRVTTSAGDLHESRMLWSTVPIPVLAGILKPAAPDEVLLAGSRLRSRAMVLVYLVLPVRRYTEFDAHYLPGPQTPVTRISEPKNYREGDDPPERTVLCAEIPCTAGGRIWQEPAHRLGSLVCETLRLLGLPPAEPVDVRVKRVPAAYPIYDLGYRQPFDLVQEWASHIPGLLSFGRHGLFAHNNSHHALEMGWAAAAALGNDGTFDEDAWSAALTRFCAHVVQD